MFCDIDQGATEAMDDDPDLGENILGELSSVLNGGHDELETIISAFDKAGASSKRPQLFLLHNRGPRYSTVQLCGSMDEWAVRHDMQFDSITNQWFVQIPLEFGEYLYKYVINGKHWVVNDEEASKKDGQGNQNNYCAV